MLFKCGKYTDIRLFGLQQIFDVSRLKSPGSDTVPVRFRLAAPRIPALSFESAGFFLSFSIGFCNFSENFCPMRVGRKFLLANKSAPKCALCGGIPHFPREIVRTPLKRTPCTASELFPETRIENTAGHLLVFIQIHRKFIKNS